MNKYKSSDLTNNRAVVLAEANKSGVIIQQLETNGKVRSELALIPMSEYKKLKGESDE